MKFQESLQTCLKKYATFEGRASRPEYWWFVLAVVVAALVIGRISSVLESLLYLAAMLPSVAAGVRRLHDTDRSGWWILLGFIPLANIVLLVWLASKGTEGSNQFGEPPVASAAPIA